MLFAEADRPIRQASGGSSRETRQALALPGEAMEAMS